MTVTENPYLLGNYAPVPDEITATDLPVTGQLPAELNGRYLRIGPNPYGPPPEPYHWFTGTGMVHGIELRNGRATWYRNRWVRIDDVATAMGETPVAGPRPPLYDSSNTNVLAHAGRVLSFTEGSMPYELTRELDTVRRTDFGGPLPAGFTAHPKVDPATGELHAFSYGLVAPPYLTYYVVGADGQLVRSVPITLPRAVMMHDFAITESHVLFFDLPVVFDLAVPAFPFRWDEDHEPRVGVMPRDGSDEDVRWFEVDRCFLYHPMNAYNDGDTIVADVPTMPSTMRDNRQGPQDGVAPTLHRWTIDLAAGKVRDELVDERGQEFPRVNETLLGSKHRYGYTMGFAGEYFKHDYERGTSEVHDFGAGREPGEFVFVAAAGAKSEDDGWLMGYVYDATTDRTDFVVLDAHDFTTSPVATVALPRRVPFGFHGNWVADA